MKELALHHPELVGREEELGRLRAKLEEALQEEGSTVFVAGEAGIGKTRLVSELIKDAEAKGAQVIRGWCLAESLEPLFPFKTAFREVGMHHLIAGAPPPKVISAYLMNKAGILAAKAEREESGLDPDIFTSMLKAVGDFVQDSLSMMGKGGQGINIIGYDRYQILLQSRGNVSLTCVIEGTQSEFLVDDMRRVLETVGDRLDGWSGEMSEVPDLAPKVSWLIESGKYDGRFLVDDPKLKQENLFDNVLLGIQRASIERPIVHFLDDLQWADPTTLSLLHYLSRNTRKNRVLIIGTYRPEDLVQSWDGRTHQLETAMQNMSREDLLERMELKRLDRSNTQTLINSALGRADFGSAFYERVHRETEGTPFFVLEVVKLLAEEGSIAQDDEGAWKLVKQIEKLDIPSKVYDVIKRRLDRLMKEQREILECASVVGEEFTPEILEGATEMRKLTLLKNLNEIEKIHRLIHYLKDKYMFDHTKIREVLYNGISEVLRKEYHRIIADTIAELHKDNLEDVISELAHHYYEAGDERAGEYLVKAGDKAKDGYANEEALRCYEHSLEVIVEEEKPVILEKLADVQALMGEFDKAIENLEKAKESTEEKETKARMLRKTGDAYEKKGEYDKSLEVLAKAKGLVEKGTAEYGRITRSEGMAYLRIGDYDQGLSSSRTALKIFEETGAAQKDIGNALRAMGNIHYSKGEYDPALEHYEKSLAVMDGCGDKVGIAATLNNIGAVHWNRGELDKALEYHGRSLEIREKIGDKQGVALSLNNIGLVHDYRGELDKALEYHGRSLEMLEKIGDKQGVAASLNNIGLVHYARGELDRALECYERSLEILEKIGDKRGIALSLTNIGLVTHDRGELEKALAYQQRCLAICLEIGDKWLSTNAYCCLTEVKLETGDVETALENAEKAVGISVEIGVKKEEAMGCRVLGMVYREMKDWNKAEEEFSKARTILEEVGDKKELARLFYEYGLMWKAKGEDGRAKEYLDKALSGFERMGMKMWAEKARRALPQGREHTDNENSPRQSPHQEDRGALPQAREHTDNENSPRQSPHQEDRGALEGL
ncbi:MAG: tetratricopeptide repeat protein [Candidatus Thermoplasmatota archaeon]